MQKKPQYVYMLRHPSTRRGKRSMLLLFLTILLLGTMTSLLSACSADMQIREQANKNRSEFDHTVQYAQSIGVSHTDLKSIFDQGNMLNATHEPLTLFSDTPVSDYNKNLSVRYKQLTVQTQGIIQVITDQSKQDALSALQNLQHTLAAKQRSDLPLTTLTQLYNQDLIAIQKARYPKEHKTISSQVKDATATINLMPDTLDKLQTLNQVITLMQQGKQDISAMQQQYDDNKNAVAKATTPQDLKIINQKVDAQNQQASTKFTKIIPVLAQAKVDELNKSVQQLQQYGIDTAEYQKHLDTDRSQLPSVKTLEEYTAFVKQVNSDQALMHKDLLKGQTTTIVKQFHSEVDNWGNAHQYADQYNGESYALDGPYMTKGLGEDLDRELNTAVTEDDYQQTLTDTQNALFHLQMMKDDSNDKTPYTQSHTTDQKLLDYYKLQNSKVIVVSFIEEALRVYDQGKLVRSFLITAGRPELPPVPGLWTPLWRATHITFKSPYPKESPYWYKDTPINYAIEYHSGGYFLHDSWWRNDYGPGTQFFHYDSSGNTSANYGTHGCVNMPTDQAEWVMSNTDYQTQMLMY